MTVGKVYWMSVNREQAWVLTVLLRAAARSIRFSKGILLDVATRDFVIDDFGNTIQSKFRS